MRKRAIKLLSVLFITSSLLVALFPFYIVFADNIIQYYPLPNNTSYYSICKFTNNSNYKDFWVKRNNADGNDLRTVVITDGNNFNIFIVTDSVYTGINGGFVIIAVNDSQSFGSWSLTNSKTVNGTNYKYWYYSFTGTPSNNRNNVHALDSTVGNMVDNAIYYTFGDGSSVPETPVINYGDLIIEGYKTDIAGQGEASINNIDHIKWNGYIDSNGNDISNCKVRLQIIPGQYTGSSKNELTNKTRQDFVLNPINASDSLFDATDGEVTLSWRDIVNRIDIIPYRLYSLELLGPDWKKDGWIYKLRLEDEENDYIGEWQTVYSSTSNGVKNDLNITNITTINQTLVQTFQELNSINNVENNWIFNNIEISVENNYTEPQSGEKPWYIYLLESILNTFNITNNYIYEGDSNTQNITNTVNDSDDDMNNKIGEYQQFEDSFIDDMDDNLTDIDTDVNFLSDNKFIASANWVVQQYNRMTNNNIIGSFIGFSLLFGLALIFIGKIH